MRRISSLLVVVCILAAQTVLAESGKISLINGNTLEFSNYEIEGNIIYLELPEGKTRLPQKMLTPESQQKFFGSVLPNEEPKPSVVSSTISTPRFVDYRAIRAEDKPAVQPETVTAPGAVVASSTLSVVSGTDTPVTIAASGSAYGLWPRAEGLAFYPSMSVIPDSDMLLRDIKTKPKVKIGKFSVKTGAPSNRSVSVAYRIPVDENNQPLASAKNIVFICPFFGEDSDLSDKYARQIYYCDFFGCTVMTVTFDYERMAGPAPEQCYWKKESGCFEVVLNARDQLCEQYNLGKQKLILFGNSNGATMAQGVAATYPQEIEAVVMSAGGGDGFQEIKDNSPVKWFILHTRGDLTADANRQLAGQLHDMGTAVVYATACPNYNSRGKPFYHHVISLQAFDLIYSYTWGILQDREKKSTGTARWPYVVPYDDAKRFQITEAGHTPPDEKESFLLPSVAFTHEWMRIPLPIQRIQLNLNNKKIPVYVGYPALAVPKGVVVYFDTYSYLSFVEDREDMAILTENGYAVIAPAQFGSKAPSPGEFLQLANQWIGSQSVFRGRPVGLYAKGKNALRFITAAEVANLNPQIFALCRLEQMDSSSDLEKSIELFADKCGLYTISLQPAQNNQSAQRLANRLITQKGQRQGCAKVEFKADEDEGFAAWKSLKVYMDVFDKRVLLK